MVIGTLRFLPPPHRRLRVLEILSRIQGPVLADPGCAGFHIYEEHEPTAAVVLVERWESMVALEEHIRSDTFRSILAALELSGKVPDVRFDHVSASEGMELVVRARTGV